MPLLHLLALAELDPPNLAARRFREVGDELYAARVLVRGGVRLAVVLNVLRQGVGRLVVLAHDDVSLHHAAPVLVRRGYDGALDYRGVLDQNALHLERPDAVAGDEQGVLGLTVAVIARESVQLFPPLYDRWVQGLAGGDGVTDGGEVRPFELGVLSEEAVLGGGLAQDGDAVAHYEGETFGGVEAALVNEDLGPLAPRPQKDFPDALGPSRAGGAPEPIPLPEVQPVLRLHPLGVRVAVGVQYALRVLRR